MTEITAAKNVVLEALKKRRSIARVRAEQPPRELIEQVLDAAVCAPNHHKTNPWRFFVLTETARERLGDVMAADARKTTIGDAATVEAAVTKARGKPLRAPVVIVVACAPADGPKIVEVEEICAVAAATENMLLAAEAVGLGAIWRTGAPAQSTAVHKFFGLAASAQILGFVYLGYPDLPELPERRGNWRAYTSWMGSDGRDR